MTQIWLNFILGVDSSIARPIIDKFQASRVLVSQKHNPEPYRGDHNRHWQQPNFQVDKGIQAPPHEAQESKSQAIRPHVPHESLRRTKVKDHEDQDESYYPHRGSSHPASSSVQVEDNRKANYAIQQFSGRKFTGNLAKSVSFLIRDYEACAHQHRLIPCQKAEYFMNIVEGSARTFFLNPYSPSMTLKEVCNIMIQGYDSDSRQLQAQYTLEGLKLDNFVSSWFSVG